MIGRNRWLGVCVAVVVVGASGSAALADEPASKPFNIGVDYTITSDYIWRGINLSEPAGERGDVPNHQLNVWLEIPTDRFGTFSASVWFVWYAGQTLITPTEDTKLQEVDYILSWAYALKPIDTTVTLGWIAYTFPPFAGDAHTTYELFVKLEYDDSKLWGTEGPVLSPYFYYGIDLDLAEHASWMEFGISHEFALADCEALENTALKHMTITPALVLGIDHRYLDKFAGVSGVSPSTRLAFINYGVSVGYDISAALGIPEKYGSVSMSGFLNFSQALNQTLLNDEFYGGATVSYAW